jgi:crotonobetainyl-CoA:carnitine CoA-transferase CaiB-like acyl-CoA transferase
LTPYQVFPCSDGHIIIATGNDGQFQRLCRVLDCAEMATDPRFLVNSDRIKNRSSMTEMLNAKTQAMTKDALLSACEAQGIPAGPINTMDEVFADPQVIARGMQVDFDGIPSVRSPFVFSDAKLKLDRPSPKLGEDNTQ